MVEHCRGRKEKKWKKNKTLFKKFFQKILHLRIFRKTHSKRHSIGIIYVSETFFQKFHSEKTYSIINFVLSEILFLKSYSRNSIAKFLFRIFLKVISKKFQEYVIRKSLLLTEKWSFLKIWRVCPKKLWVCRN